MSNKHIKLKKDNEHLNIYLISDIDRIGKVDYQVRIYGAGVTNEDLQFTYKNFSKGTSFADKGNEGKINHMSEQNKQDAEKYFDGQVEYYLTKGYIEVPSLIDKISNTIDSFRNKFLNKDIDKEESPKLKK